MSKRVFITCTLLLLLGVGGLLDTASAFVHDAVHINLLILLLPVAIGLFLALPGSRLAASIVFSVLYFFLAMLLLAPLMGPIIPSCQIIHADFFIQSSFSLVFVSVSLIGSLLVLLHWMLFSSPFEEHLER